MQQLFIFVSTSEFVWSQEEARNAGAWSFVRPRFENALGISVSPTSLLRRLSACSAIGGVPACCPHPMTSQSFGFSSGPTMAFVPWCRWNVSRLVWAGQNHRLTTAYTAFRVPSQHPVEVESMTHPKSNWSTSSLIRYPLSWPDYTWHISSGMKCSRDFEALELLVFPN